MYRRLPILTCLALGPLLAALLSASLGAIIGWRGLFAIGLLPAAFAFVIRLWVAIGILAVLKRLWDKWGPGGSSRLVSDSARPADVARRAPGGPPEAEPGADARPAAPQAPS